MAGFTVDTHVFRELGELLVGRDSTALIELIKNAYDADATLVVVHGDHLSDLGRGSITVLDDGVGMNQKQFEDGFLRIASRSKDTGTRRSKRFGRQYTGAKGIGRLAAHKLSRKITIESTAWGPNGKPSSEGVSASIDWDLVEKNETLEQVSISNAIIVTATAPGGANPGTTITLERLRRKWTPTQRGRFLEELQTFAPPASLIEQLPPAVLDKELLFAAPAIRDGNDTKPFTVDLIGELAPPDDYWTAALAAANWIIEIDAVKEPGKVHYGIAPTKRTQEDNPELRPRKFTMPHPAPKDGPRLQARILIRAGHAKGSADAKAWAGRANGIRVYMEGFRVLPYGELRNDWLGLDRDASERAKDLLSPTVAALVQPKLHALGADERPGLSHLPSKHYFGAVFLTQVGAPRLRPLVNREGFVPDDQYDAAVMIVRTAIDLATRVRAAASSVARTERRSSRSTDGGSSGDAPQTTDIGLALRSAESHAAEARTYAAAGNSRAAATAANLAIEQIRSVTAGSEEIADQAAMLRVLASVGTQLSSFVHELRSLLAMAEAVEAALASVIEESTELKRESKSRLRGVLQSVGDLRRQLEREASYLIDVVSPDSVRRRSRQSLSKRFESAARLIAMSASRRGTTVENLIPLDVKSPPMFSAELTSVFANLLTNAIKAAGTDGRIRATGTVVGDATSIRIENTGVRVNINTAERWFRPFESSTTEVDSILGQGMGLGLTITRRILDEYGSTIRFVKPSSGYETALEITFNG